MEQLDVFISVKPKPKQPNKVRENNTVPSKAFTKKANCFIDITAQMIKSIMEPIRKEKKNWRVILDTKSMFNPFQFCTTGCIYLNVYWTFLVSCWTSASEVIMFNNQLMEVTEKKVFRIFVKCIIQACRKLILIKKGLYGICFPYHNVLGY